MWGFRPKTKRMHYIKLLEFLPSKLIMEGSVHAADNYYLMPLDPWYVMQKIKSYKYKYKKERRDCDDFVRIFRGILSQKGYGNLLAMDCLVDTPEGDHRLIGFINPATEEIMYGEPQTGHVLTKEESGKIRPIKIEL